MAKRIFVTVGSTHFDELIKVVDSQEFVDIARQKGYGEIVAQIGKYEGEKLTRITRTFPYAKPDEFKTHLEAADLVIGHAGAGTIMEVLQLGKPLIVVVNSALMNDHQTEVAQAFAERDLLTMTHASELINTFKTTEFRGHKISMSSDWIVQALDEHFT